MSHEEVQKHELFKQGINYLELQQLEANGFGCDCNMRGESTQDIKTTARLASTLPKTMRSRKNKARTAHENDSIANESITGMMTPFAVTDEQEMLDINLPQPITI